MLCCVLFQKWSVFSCIVNNSITLWLFFSLPEIGRIKTTDYTFEEKIGVLFRFNAGNYFYELKNKSSTPTFPKSTKWSWK